MQQPTTSPLPVGLVQELNPRLFLLRSRVVGVIAMFVIIGSIFLAMLIMQPPEDPEQEGLATAGGGQVAAIQQTNDREASAITVRDSSPPADIKAIRDRTTAIPD